MPKRYLIPAPWPVGQWLIDAGSIVEEAEGGFLAVTGNLAGTVLVTNALPPGAKEIEE